MDDATKLAALRQNLATAGVEGFLIPRADEFLGEYVPPSGERLAWLTGFTGSAGMAIVLPNKAALFTDGRYTTQAAQQTNPSLWDQRHITENPPGEWLKLHAAGLRIGYDPWLLSEAALRRFTAEGITLVPLASNPLDAAWADRPAPPLAAAQPHPLDYAGTSAEEKRATAAQTLREAGEAAVVLADPHSVAWLLNIRGADLENTPLALAFALLHADARVELFLDPVKIPPATAAHLGNAVQPRPRAELPAALAALAGTKVRIDPELTPAWFTQSLRTAGATPQDGEDPCRLPRACKNPVEQQGSRAAHRRDGAAMANFLAWFATAAPTGSLTEIAAAEHLLACRQAQPLFRAESFPAISGAGEHGAIVHYRAIPESDRAINPNECFLLDSGGQYLDGTTDITRTLWTGPGPAPAQLKERFTRVLLGHIALATLRFPKGVAGPHIDILARRALWDVGLDYDHGTGHGIGSFLSVHEGPAGISRAARPVALQPGMILSDEPGFYLPGHYGIRIENLVLVQQAPALPDQQKPFLQFETLTLAPYDRALIDLPLLGAAGRAWVDSYHAEVLAQVAPLCEAATAAWLKAACAPL